MDNDKNSVIRAVDFIANRQKYINGIVRDQVLAINNIISEYIYKLPENNYLNSKSTIASTLIPLDFDPLKNTIQVLKESGWNITFKDGVNYLSVNLVSESVNSFLAETQTNVEKQTNPDIDTGNNSVVCEHPNVEIRMDFLLTSNPPKYEAMCLDCRRLLYINDNDPRVLASIVNDPEWGLRVTPN